MNLNLSATYADVQRIDRLLTNGLNLSSKFVVSRFVEILLVSDMWLFKALKYLLGTYLSYRSCYEISQGDI